MIQSASITINYSVLQLKLFISDLRNERANNDKISKVITAFNDFCQFEV